MAHTIFTALSNLRMILDTETDGNSPDNETTYGGIRKAIESIIWLAFGTGDDGYATSDPVTATLTDTNAAYDTDEHYNHTLLITSGNAIGNFYTIDSNTATTLVCTGDNLYSDGVRQNDYYRVLYDIKVNTDGHDHDGINSKEAVLSKGRVMLYTQAEEDWTEYSNNAEAYVTEETLPIYVPVDANTLYVMAHHKGNGVANANFKFTINSQDSNVAQTSQATNYEWNEVYKDCSGFTTGMYEVEMKIATTTAGNNAYLNGYIVYWGP